MRALTRRAPRRRLGRSRVLFFVAGVLLGSVYALALKARLPRPRAEAQTGGAEVAEVTAAGPRASNGSEGAAPPGGTEVAPLVVTSTSVERCVYVDPQPPEPRTPPPPPPPTAPRPKPPPPHRKGEYPADMFSVEQRRRGWVLLHVLGMTYMFVALAIVCDEFFVPALEVITERLQISDDVAGATFMAAGGSAPELFTSLIGVFISHSNVGIGTIVGSAVFNILFVIGMCAIFSREVLHLTWWPLFRDVTFYILDLVLLIVFFLDKMILWWESLLLVLGYVSYVAFMKFNGPIEQALKTQLNKHASVVKVWSADEPEKDGEAPPPPPPPPPAPSASVPEDKSKPEPEPPQSPGQRSPPCTKQPSEPHEDKTRLRARPVLQRGGSTASLHNTSLRSTIFQLMIHTLDPLGEDMSFNGDVRMERAAQRKAKNKVKPLNVPVTDKPQSKCRDRTGDDKPKCDQAPAASSPGDAAAEPSTSQLPKTETSAERTSDKNHQESKPAAAALDPEESEDSAEDQSDGSSSSDSSASEDDEGQEAEAEESEPLSLEWPRSRRKQATYLLLLPIVLPLWVTLPDVRNPESRKYFAATFVGCILWIAVFSYLMVWWAHQVGETVGISEEIMGLTILAAGTSIPDLITSVIVARKGLGDMAVSSSVGSNIFDITVGLPVPWLMYTLSHHGEPVTVSSNGLFCAIVLLFLMLLFVIMSIAACRWKMSRMLGLTMFVLYFVFLVLSVLLEDRILTCPVSI
ncbi:sodium/potassium/calcium exchanger 1-like isoform X2 [Betta splendens]|uniref:Sodium/potassium/calcium exchanger 1 n=1 Tax=Betta splendens TaxID=158456 RepID=A0A6P7LZS6_BETSP|nr:sodium/potassium/calcium exchanger 1-like isoform X2 [Betta splendens]